MLRLVIKIAFVRLRLETFLSVLLSLVAIVHGSWIYGFIFFIPYFCGIIILAFLELRRGR